MIHNTKTNAVAEWLYNRGVSMTARQMIRAGFQFQGEHKATNTNVGQCLTNLCDNPRYVIEKCYVQDGGRRMLSVLVKDIKEPAAPKRQSHEQRINAMWRELLTR